MQRERAVLMYLNKKFFLKSSQGKNNMFRKGSLRRCYIKEKQNRNKQIILDLNEKKLPKMLVDVIRS